MRQNCLLVLVLAAMGSAPAVAQEPSWADGSLEVSLFGARSTLVIFPGETPEGEATYPEEVSGSGNLYGLALRYVPCGHGFGFGGGGDFAFGSNFGNDLDYSPKARAEMFMVRAFGDLTYSPFDATLDSPFSFDLRLVARVGLQLSAADAARVSGSPRLQAVLVFVPRILALELDGGPTWAVSTELKGSFKIGDAPPNLVKYGDRMGTGVDVRAALLGPELGKSGVAPMIAVGWLRHPFPDKDGRNLAVASEWALWAGLRL